MSDETVNVAITATSDQLNAGMSQAVSEVQSGAHSMESAFESVGDTVKSLAELIGVAFTANAFKDWIGGALEASEQAEHLSMSLGVTTETIQTMSYAAGLTGSSLETASSAMVRLERSASLAQDSTTKQAAAFRDLGISSSQLADLLQHPDDLLKTVTADLAKFTDGANKNAVGIELMGRSFATNAALFSELGNNFDALRQRAEDLGIVLSDTDQKALADAQRGFNDLGEQVKGLGNQMAIALLPAINSVREGLSSMLSSGDFKSFLSGAATDFNQLIVMAGQLKDALHFDGAGMGWNDLVGDVANVGRALVNLGTSAENVFVRMGLIMEDTWVGFENDVKDAISVAEMDLAGMLSNLGKAFSTLSPDIALGLQALSEGLAANSKEFTYATVNVAKYADAIDQNNHEAFEAKIAIDQWADGVRGSATALGTAAEAANKGTQALGPLDDGLKKTQQAAAELNKELSQWQIQMDALAEKSAGPYDAANLQYLATITKLNDEIVTMIGNGLSLAQAEEMDAQATDLATAAMYRSIAADLTKNDAIDTWYQKLINSTAQLGLLTNAEKASADFDAIATKNLIDNRDVQGQWYDTAQEAIDANAKLKQGYVDGATALMNEGDALKQSQALIKSWASTVEQDAVGAFNTFLTDLEQGKSVMKDLGDAFTNLVNQILAEAFKLEVVGPIINSVFGLSGSSALPTGDIAQGALSKLLGGSFGGGGTSGTDPDFLAGGALASGPYSGIGSSFGYGGGIGAGAGILGGAAAGYNEYNAAGGGIAGLTGGAAYGIGTFAIGGAISAGVSAAAAGGISAGLSAGFAAIPVVGWIALAAMGLNAVTGGGLFGTAAKPTGSEENLSVGDSGASISAAIDEKGKKALFGGSYYKTVSTPVDQATQDSVAAFFTGLQSAANAEAQAFGQSTGDIVEGTFHETFDKAGKMLTEVSTIAGQNFTESITDFQNRILGDTLLANMGDASAEAEKIAEQWQQSASDLLAGAEFLSQAQLDINQGHALVGGDTLTQLTAFMESMSAQGETLIQTYARLSVETSDVQGILTNLGLDTGKTGEALVKFDDDMVKAAGSLDNLNTLWNNYYNEFYSASEQQAITLKNLQTTVNTDFAAIGEDPSESLAQFRTDFEKALPTLTPDQVVQWLDAGDALYKLSQAAGAIDTAAATAAQNLMDSASKMADTIKQTEADAQSLSASLFGTDVQQLQAQLDSYKGSDMYFPEMVLLQPQIDAAQAQQDATAHLGDATKLLSDIASIGAVSGQSLQDLAQQDHIPLDKLAGYLGTDKAGLEKQFAADEAISAASLNIDNNTKLSAEYLQDIRDILEGKTPTFGADALQNASSGIDPGQPAISTSKGRGGSATPPVTSPDVVGAVTDSSQIQTAGFEKIAGLLQQIEATLRGMGAAGASVAPPQTRGFRTSVAKQAF